VDKKLERQYLGGKKRDLHESDINHLKRSEETYRQLAEAYPSEFAVVECVEDGKLLSIDAVHEKVWLVFQKTVGR